MTNLRQAAQQALEALEEYVNVVVSVNDPNEWTPKVADAGEPARKAITAIKAALAQPEQQAEPVLLECVTCGTVYADGVPPQVPVQQQTEPVAWMDREGDLYKMPEIKNWAPPHTMLYTAPPQREWDKPNASFNEWWDSYRHNPANPFAEGSAAYWAWAGWQAATRPWVGLTDEEIDDIYWGAGKHDLLDARAIEAKLKEKNDH